MRPGEKPQILTEAFWSAAAPSVSFDGRRFVFVARRQAAGPSEIWEMRTGGSGSRRIARSQGQPDDPAYLPDGRIVYSDVVTTAGGPGAARAVFSCASDGADVRRLSYGDHVDAHPVVLPDGRVRFERRVPSSDGPATLVPMVIHPDGTGATRFAGTEPSTSPGASAHAVPTLDGFVVLSSTPVVQRPVPPVLASVVNPARTTGTLLCLNAYVSQIPSVARLPRGAIERVRVTAATPESSGRGDAAVFGEAPVHPDGSFFVEVPADTPIGLVLLDKDGRALATFASGVWVRPNENRGCVGCHEEPDRVPENRMLQAVLTPPVSATGQPSQGKVHAPR